MDQAFEMDAAARKLRELRVAKGKTVCQMSDETGLGRTAITNYENGIRTPKDAVKVKLARYFEKSVDEIFFSA